MKNFETTIAAIAGNSTPLNREGIKRVLILYEEKISFIGDCCLRFGRFKYFSLYFNHPFIQINFTNKSNFKFYDGLLKNNPHIHSVSELHWDKLDFSGFDAVFCVMYNEEKFLEFLNRKYGEQINNGSLKLAVYSMSEVILATLPLTPFSDFKFTVDEEMMEYLKLLKPTELYISDAEQHWAEQWLKSKGLREEENLLVVLDSASTGDKVLSIMVYFEFLKVLLETGNGKALIFDENAIGKEAFYRQWLGDELTDRIIFSEGLSLRDNLCLIGSRHTKLVVGPCTGLMHCASSIYNNYVGKGMDPRDVPLMVVYTGKYSKGNINANFWWAGAPLVNCLLLKEKNNKKEVVLLSSLPEEERNLSDTLPCSDYTTQMLTDFISQKIGVTA